MRECMRVRYLLKSLLLLESQELTSLGKNKSKILFSSFAYSKILGALLKWEVFIFDKNLLLVNKPIS